MPGGVIKVRRREKLGFSARLYLPTFAKGLAVTTAHFLRNLRGASRRRSEFAVGGPEERADYADAFRGMPVLVALESGEPRCVACGLCEFACPADCIEVVAEERPGSAVERAPAVFELDMARCMFCGLCEEACPEEAIVMSRAVLIAGYDRTSLQYSLDDLLVPESLLERRVAFLRSEYDRPDAEPAPTGVGS